MKTIIQKTKLCYLLYGRLLMATQCVCSCTADKAEGPGLFSPSGEASMTSNAINMWSPWVAISDTKAKSLEIYNYSSTTWNSSTRNWLFKPTNALRFSSGAIAALNAGMEDFWLHYTTGFPNKAVSAIVVQGGRWLGIAAYIPAGSYVKGQKLWEYTFPTSEDRNNHAVELLPNGNIAVAGFGDGTAASHRANWVRIYNTADPSGSSYAQVNIIAPHALLYDSIRQRLWAAG